MPQLFPFLFARHSDALVILTVRDSQEWFERRVAWSGGQNKTSSDPAPLSWISGNEVRCAYSTRSSKVQNVDEYMNRLGNTAAAWTFWAQAALTACLVPPAQLLLFDLFSDNQTDADHWRTLARFVNRTAPTQPLPFHGRCIG